LAHNAKKKKKKKEKKLAGALDHILRDLRMMGAIARQPLEK
jgi:hypothetical protein